MPYESNEDLPEDVQDALPEHAQEIYREAFNSAWEQYEDPEDRRGDESREATAHQVAWSAVKDEYKKDEETGEWKKEEGEDE
jgi:cation transport regulator